MMKRPLIREPFTEVIPLFTTVNEDGTAGGVIWVLKMRPEAFHLVEDWEYNDDLTTDTWMYVPAATYEKACLMEGHVKLMSSQWNHYYMAPKFKVKTVRKVK